MGAKEKDTKRPFLDFYKENRISPVTQDISDLERHFARRGALYRHLGIPPGFLSGRRIIEFGVGSGYNALFTLSLDPAEYVLVDGNPTGLERARELLSPRPNFGKCRLVEALIEDFPVDTCFDVVLCEAVIPFQNDPSGFARKVGAFARPGGLVVVTCVDPVSWVSEALRRVLVDFHLRPGMTVQQMVDCLLPVFRDHLASLKGMSRPHSDWILDNMIHPIKGRLFSVQDAIEALEDSFDIYGSSPHFLTDWRWYKEIGRDTGFNDLAIREYRRNLHNFLDHRFVFPALEEARGQELLERCQRICSSVMETGRGFSPDTVRKIADEVSEVARTVARFSPETAAALEDFVNGVFGFLSEGKVPPVPRFAPLFGRGQSYLSFMRRR